MAMLRITAFGNMPVCAEASGLPVESLLAAHLGALPQGAPLVFVTHGFRYSPWHPQACPYDTLLSTRPQRGHWKARPLPRKLGLSPDQSRQGLCITLGWHGRGTLGAAMSRAAAAGQAMARVADIVTEQRPDLRLNAVSHSLGAAVLMSALKSAQTARFQRLLLLTPAELRASARVAMAAPAAQNAEVISVLTRENALFAHLFAGYHRAGRTLASGLPEVAQWADLPLSEPCVVRNLAAQGFRLGPQTRRICHWSSFLRPGVWRLYRRILFAPEALPLSVIRSLKAPPKGQQAPFAPMQPLRPSAFRSTLSHS